MTIGVNSVSIGVCTNGQITVTATITFPAVTQMKEAKAIILNNAGSAVSQVFPLANISGDNYIGTVSGVPPGTNYKAQVFANWLVAGADDKTSTNTTTCAMPLPPPPPSPPPSPLPPPPPMVRDKKR